MNVWRETWQRFYCKFLAESKCERILTSANIWQNYKQKYRCFFWLTVYMICWCCSVFYAFYVLTFFYALVCQCFNNWIMCWYSSYYYYYNIYKAHKFKQARVRGAGVVGNMASWEGKKEVNFETACFVMVGFPCILFNCLFLFSRFMPLFTVNIPCVQISEK